MPRAARFKIKAVEALLRQLEYAPAETRQRQMEAAERLIADIDPHINYPEDFIVYRITGYRPDRADEPVTLVGEALLPDLVTLVQTLSADLDLKADEFEGEPLPLDEVARRFRVSVKSIQRYRKQGLVCTYVTFADGVRRLACTEQSIRRFAERHGPELQRAASFSRVGAASEAEIIERARALRKTESCSLNEAALQLSRQVGRAHETVRMLLRRHDRKAVQPIFSERGPLTDRDATLIHRAWLRGVEISAFTGRFGKTKPTINRAVNRRRRDVLQSARVEFTLLPIFERPDAASVILTAAVVTNNLPAGVWTDAIGLIETIRLQTPASADDEATLVAAMNMLKRRASTATRELGEWPTAEALDQIETDLRWASSLKRRLLLLGLPAAMQRVQHQFERPIERNAADELIALLEVGIHTCSSAVDGLDPSRGQRLERVISLAMDKALAKIVMPQISDRAAAMHGSDSTPMADPLSNLNDWDSWLNLRGDLKTFVKRLLPPARSVIETRFGLTGMPPLTVEATAEQLSRSMVSVVREFQQAIRQLRAMARGR